MAKNDAEKAAVAEVSRRSGIPFIRGDFRNAVKRALRLTARHDIQKGKLFRGEEHQWMLETLRDEVARIWPDAYCVTLPLRILTCLEIEASCRLNEWRLRSYADLSNTLDYFEWSFQLVTANQWGNVFGEFPIMEFVAKLPEELGSVLV